MNDSEKDDDRINKKDMVEGEEFLKEEVERVEMRRKRREK